MKQDGDDADPTSDDPDLLENSGLPKSCVVRLRSALFTRLSDFDGISDVDILREPGVSKRIVKAIRTEQARTRRSS
ncbi:hypothetical protein [Rhizobium rhizogenes]|uniref:hypothetical protein n=1 Tax=Rhizobium rhizogenes TaxID=359 RepID=UPI001574B0D2|nr:hypothetical protein [Rhizobium rhizogenes]NTG64723.1 hypothetical protein [Rhizobium rhizogenes]NTH68448.1 hypothetical protein [Rhizobium rhizogenes]NTH99925.1 hypothetical protein [Rhizobium rhizogenes]NTI39077.1 hypothetical protein [Rhizobium rhizogenes]NTJ18217.1 hypothetical protein [Rhizobium rhizogenes]